MQLTDQQGTPVSCSFEHALWHAAWFCRYALDRAPDEHLHPGVIGHLVAARTQLDAVAALAATVAPPV